jgi:hypothetical protein
MLGLEFDPEGRRILLINPRLPALVRQVIIRNVTLGEARADFAARQEGEAIAVQTLHTTGDLQISLLRRLERRRRRAAQLAQEGCLARFGRLVVPELDVAEALDVERQGRERHGGRMRCG